MSQETDRAQRTAGRQWRHGVSARSLPSAEATVTVAGSVAVLTVAAWVLLRVLHNAPFDPLAVPAAVTRGGAVGVALAVGLATITVAIVAQRTTVRVGLLFAGVFGSLAAVDPAATLPAVVGVTGGGAVALVGIVGRPTDYWTVRREVVAVGFAIAVALSLSSAVGLLPVVARPAGAWLALLSLAATPLVVDAGRNDLLAGGLVAAGVGWVGTNAPFVAGATLLVGFAVVGVPHVVVALGVGGGVAAAATGIRGRSVPLASGAGLLVLAGAPVTLPRAGAVVLGAALLFREASEP